MAQDGNSAPPAPVDVMPSASGRWAGRAREAGLRLGGLIFAILIVVMIFTFLSKPNTFLTIINALGMLRYMSTIAIVALGLTLVIVVGEIDLSFGYMYGLASTVIAVAWIIWGWPLYLAIPLAFAVAIVVGCFNALLVTVLKIPSFIVTLGSGQLIFGFTLLISNTATFNPAYPSGGRVVPKEELDFFFGLAKQNLALNFPMQGLWMILVAVIIGFLLSRSLFGFRLKAIGGNPLAAELARLPVRKYKFASFIICSMCLVTGSSRMRVSARI